MGAVTHPRTNQQMITSLKVLGRNGAAIGCSALLLAACGGQTSGPAATASPSATPTPTPTPPASSAPVVLAQSVGTIGTILVAASNGLTVYTFSRDSRA